MKEIKNVLSLFDGISAGQLALNKAGVNYEKYYSYEIDKYAIKTTMKNFQETIQMGDILNFNKKYIPEIDLLIGGSPCHGFSRAGKGLNFNDPRSMLFFKFAGILRDVKPKYFLLENVKMKKEWVDIISEIIGVSPILINSSLVSAQNRERYYWTNIQGIGQPEDRGILLENILETDTIFQYPHGGSVGGIRQMRKSASVTTGYHNNYFKILSGKELGYMFRTTKDGRNHFDFKHHSDTSNKKSSTVVSNFHKGVPYNVIIDRTKHGIVTDKIYRKITPVECERLQTIPDNYTAGVSDTQRYKQIGNSWTVDVIAHIFKNIK